MKRLNSISENSASLFFVPSFPIATGIRGKKTKEMKLVCCLLFFSGFLSGIPLSSQEVENHLAGIFADTSIVHITRININTKESDFGVTKYKSGYVFTSSKNEHVGIQYFSGDTMPLLDLYYFHRKDSLKFSRPKPFAKELNSKYNDGPATFSHDGNTIVLTRNLPVKLPPDSGFRLQLVLMISKYENGKWQKPEVLPFCLPAYNYTHPSFAPGDSLLYFTSNCPGGYGGSDIYYSRLTANGWSKPVNPGKKLNSEYDEEFPFCAPSGNLYFDSNRPGGYGMLDIYAWDVNDSAFASPELLAGTINSAADDFGFWCAENEAEGFFSSNRNNKPTDDDIYYFNADWPEAITYDTLKKPELCYEFFEEASVEKEDTVDMAYQWTFSDGTVKTGYKVSKCFDTTGTYTVSLDIRDSSSGEMFISNKMTYELEILPPNAITVPLPDTIFLNQPFIIDSGRVSANGFRVKSVYYDFGHGYKSHGRSAMHVYHKEGTYYPLIFFRVTNEQTGTEECRCVVKKLIVE